VTCGMSLINSIQPFFELRTTHCMFSSPSEYVQNFKKNVLSSPQNKYSTQKPNFFFSIMNGFLEFHGVYRSTKRKIGNFFLHLALLVDSLP